MMTSKKVTGARLILGACISQVAVEATLGGARAGLIGRWRPVIVAWLRRIFKLKRPIHWAAGVLGCWAAGVLGYWGTVFACRSAGDGRDRGRCRRSVGDC